MKTDIHIFAWVSTHYAWTKFLRFVENLPEILSRNRSHVGAERNGYDHR